MGWKILFTYSPSLESNWHPKNDNTLKVGIFVISSTYFSPIGLCSHQSFYNPSIPFIIAFSDSLVHPVYDIINPFKWGIPFTMNKTPRSPTRFPLISTDLTCPILLAISLQLSGVILLFLISSYWKFLKEANFGIYFKSYASVIDLLLNSRVFSLLLKEIFFQL